MGTVTVTVTMAGGEQVMSRLSNLNGRSEQNIEALMNELAGDTQTAWQEVTPRRSGRLQDSEMAVMGDMEFSLISDVWYYSLVDEGHKTARGWRTKHGYRQAKHRTEVPGKRMTQQAVDFAVEHITGYLSHVWDEI